MQKSNCLKQVNYIFVFLLIFILAGLKATPVFSATNNVINFQGKIVRNDSGYEGLNVVAGTPSCVVSGAGNDTCDFRVRYYSASSGGTLFITEAFSNVEIGAYNGAFDLSLGSDPAPTAGSHASVDAMIKAESTIYVELGFDPAGGGSYTETFTRMPVAASAFAIRAKYASEASSEFTFFNASSVSGTTEGMVYYDTDDDVLMLYTAAGWTEVGGGTGSSLFSDAGDYTYLTDSDDDFVLGDTTYTAIGADSYSTYMAGLGSRAPFSLDYTAGRVTISASAAQSGLTVYSDYSSTNAWPVVSFKAEGSGFDNTILELTQDGTGDLLTMKKGSTDAFIFENAITMYIRQITGAPSTTTDRLYNLNGTLYWNGSALTSGTGLWSDGGTFAYLTTTTDDVVIGGDTEGSAKFFFDVSSGNLGIGTSTPGSKLEIAGASSSISNTSGDITISPDDTLIIKANDAQADNFLEFQNSSSTVLGLVDSYGYFALGRSTANSSAILSIGANTSSVAQINLASSSGTDVSAPNSGDLWWTGTHLYFYDGTDAIDLLSGGGGGLFTANGSVIDGSYLNVDHAANTYSVLADGWVCEGGSADSSCTGGKWRSIKDTNITVSNTLSNDWNKADPDGMIRTQTRLTDVELAPGIDVGTGADGDITVSGDTDINSTSLISGRSCSDGGDAVNYNVTAFNVGGTEATLSSSPSTGCLNVGDEVLIINLQGTSTAYPNVGNYETLEVADVDGTTVTFATPKINYYGDTSTGDTNLGTSSGTQRVMLQRVPNYNDVTVNSTKNFYPSDWDGSKGGIIFFRANGTVTNNGIIHADGKGYRGGASGSGNLAGGVGGEAFCAPNTESASAGGTGGDTGSTGGPPTAGENGLCGGGGGSGANDAVYGTIGYGTASLGGAGGGGGAAEDSTSGYEGYAGGGGGGGYGTGGLGASGSAAGSAGGDGSTNQSGNGASGGSASHTYGGNAGGGGTYGVANLSKLMFGSGGGAGGDGEANDISYYQGAAAGDGAGIIFISATTITNSGTIHATGSAGSAGDTVSGGGGGGAGGSVKIMGEDITLGTGIVTAAGGAGGGGGSGTAGDGGTGGSGRIAIYYASSLSGSTTPTSTDASVGYNNYGIYTSPVISTMDAQTYDNIRWNETLDTYGNISVQTRSGGTTDSTDGSWEAWKPFTATTNYISLNDANTHTDWSGVNATVADGDVTRNIDFFEDEDESTVGNITKITSSTDGGYAEATITSVDLSVYDYVTFWVRASQTGNTIRFGIGESAATEQYEEVTIDTADTWQKVYWDISDITGTSRDGITKLRITNETASSNTIYLDNVRGEELTTINTGSQIYSTANDYIQYRIIFTTTNTSYYPRLENISISYNSGYRIVVQDDDNVRLYNYTGSTKYLKLDVATTNVSAGSGAGVGSATVVLSSEYAGAVLSGDGTNNIGSMTSDNEGTSSDSMNYYEWSSSETSLNDYDVRVRFTLPVDFNAWDVGGITLNYSTESTSSSNSQVDLYVYEESSASIDGTDEDNVSSVAGVWTSTTIAGSTLSECTGAGTTCMILMRMSSKDDYNVRIGDIDITYEQTLY